MSIIAFKHCLVAASRGARRVALAITACAVASMTVACGAGDEEPLTFDAEVTSTKTLLDDGWELRGKVLLSSSQSAEATEGMLAQRGRASYTGERSRASVDAGAVGVAVMFEAVSEAWRESELERT